MPLFALLNATCLGILALLLIAAAAQDVRTLHIANGLPLAIAGLFALWSLAGLVTGQMSSPAVAWSIGCALAVLAAGAAAFAAGVLGGGDVKLLAAVSLFAGPGRLLDLLAVTALAGGLLGLAILAGAPIGRSLAVSGNGTLRARLRRRLPYGPAIAAGGLSVAVSLVMG